MLNVFTILPKVFRTAQLIMDVLRGDRTEEKLNLIVDEIYGLLKEFPQVSAIMGLLESVIRIVRTLIPLATSSDVVSRALTADGIEKEDLEAASAIVEIFDLLEQKLQDEGDEIDKKIATMSDKEVLDIV